MGCDIHAYVETMYLDVKEPSWSQQCAMHVSRDYALFALMAGVRRYSPFPDVKLLEEALKKRGVATLEDPRLSTEESSNIVQEACDNGITGGVESFPAKGIPRDLCFLTEMEYTLRVSNECENEDGFCSESSAVGWVKNGCSEVWDEEGGKPSVVTNPDWHSASWLSTEEVGVLVERFKKVLETQIPFAEEAQKKAVEWATKAVSAAKERGDVEHLAWAERELEREKKWSTHDPFRSSTLSGIKAIHAMMQAYEENNRFKARLVFWFDN